MKTNVNCVFLLDADPSARRGLVRLLRAAGYDVRAFAHADEFIDALGSKEADCVVLDAGMTELPVEELQAQFNRCGVYLPVVVVTTHNDRQTRTRADKLNAIGFYRKPVDGPSLLDTIEWAIRSRSTNGKHQRI